MAEGPNGKELAKFGDLVDTARFAIGDDMADELLKCAKIDLRKAKIMLHGTMSGMCPRAVRLMEIVATGDIDAVVEYLEWASMYWSTWRKGRNEYDSTLFCDLTTKHLFRSERGDKQTRLLTIRALFDLFGPVQRCNFFMGSYCAQIANKAGELHPVVAAALCPIDPRAFLDALGVPGFDAEFDITPVIVKAIEQGADDVVCGLVRSGYKFNLFSCFCACVNTCDLAMLKMVFEESKPEPSHLNLMLKFSVNEKLVEVVDLLLEMGVSPNHRFGRAGNTMLMVAVCRNCPDIMSLLIAAGANINSRKYKMTTALHIAAYHGYVECVRVLLAQPGLEKNPKRTSGATPLDEAERRGNSEVVDLLT